MTKQFPFTFLDARKVTKETCTEKEILKFPFVTLKENNSPDKSESNRFSFLTLHYGQFLSEFLFRCEEGNRNLFEVGAGTEK